MRKIQNEGEIAGFMSLATTVFLLPFLLFSMHAGGLADHFSKRGVLMVSKAAETAVMLFCMAGIVIFEDFSYLLVYLLFGLFFMGAQSTYYSPAKFGILPELLPEKLLSWGNGVFELSGMIAIILGSISGAECVGFFEGRLHLAPALFAVAAALGLLATWFVPHVAAAAPSRPIPINPLIALREQASHLIRNRILFLTLIAVVFIWSLGVLFQLNMALYAKDDLGFDERHTAIPMGIVAVGVGLGTMLAGLVSGKTIEVGLVPIASVGVALASVVLSFTAGSFIVTFAAVAMLGVFAGLFIVPTHALLQEESPTEHKGGIWAATNLLQTVGMLIAAEIFALLHGIVHLSAPQVFFACGWGILGLAMLLLFLLPESLGRMAAWLRIFLAYRGDIRGQHHVPAQGPILFLIAGPPQRQFYLLMAGTRRFVRFVLPQALLRGLFSSVLGRTLNAIRIEPAAEAAIRQEAAAALRKGHTLAIFSDGTAEEPTLSSHALSELLGEAAAPVIPVVLQKDGKRFLLRFEPSWDRNEPPEALLERLRDQW